MEVRRTFALLLVLSALTLSVSASPVICTPLVIDGFKKGCVINGNKNILLITVSYRKGLILSISDLISHSVALFAERFGSVV